MPTNVIDYAARDRRWAQGNLQHLGVMWQPGLHWLNRLHMLTGVLGYATSPMWFMVLIVSSIMTSIQAVMGHQYFAPGSHTLFPAWPQYRDGEIAAVLTMTGIMLFMPKLLGATLALRDSRLRAAYGGARRLMGGMLIEQFMSMLLAPTMMLFHSTFVVSALFGRSVGWDAQPRGDRGISWREGLMRHKWHLLLGLVWGARDPVVGAKVHLVDDPCAGRHDHFGALHSADQPRQPRARAARARLAGDARGESSPRRSWQR